MPGSTIRLAAAILGTLLGMCSANVVAQPSVSAKRDYIRTDFTVEDGLPDNVVNAIIQTENGLLWVGTQAGLATFDGREFHPVNFEIPGAPSQGAVQGLLLDSNGDLWVGGNAGLVLIPKAALDNPEPVSFRFFRLGKGKSDEVEAIYQARNGVLWVGTTHGLYRKDGGNFVSALQNISVSRLDETTDGNLLIVTNKSLLEYDGQKATAHPDLFRRFNIHEDEIFDLHRDHKGTLWYSTAAGVRRERGNVFAPLLPTKAFRSPSQKIYEDPEGNTWIANVIGVFQVNGDKLASTVNGVFARCIFVSRDGGLWLGTNGNGLVRFRSRIVKMLGREEGLAHDIAMTVLPSHDGRLWIGSNCGLSVYNGKKFKNYTKAEGMANTCVWTLAEDRQQNLWIGTYGGGLLRFKNGHFTQYSTEQGLVSKIVFHIQVAHDDSLWIATPDGVSHMENGEFRNYTTADGLSSNRTLSVHEDRAQTIWVESQAGIDRLSGNVFRPFAPVRTASDQLATRFGEDSLGGLYAMNANIGASLIENGHMRTVNDDLNLIDMVEVPDQSLWFSSRNGIFRFAREYLRNPASRGDFPLEFNSLDRADGLNSTQCSVGSPNIAITPDQKLWVATVKGLAMVDLRSWPAGSRKPKIFLQAVTLEGKQMPAANQLVFPPGNHRVEFHLAAVDLASPEKVRLQYRMDGVDTSWVNAGSSRTAVYTYIPTGTHSFVVRATDSNGKWDQIGRTYSITQKPFLYQTGLFQIACVFLMAALLSIAYVARVRHLITHTRTLLEERLSERERIARDLHDTFFQGIQGLFLRFNTGTSQLPTDLPARKIFVEALEQSDKVMLEGRELVLDLRATLDAADLAEMLARAGTEFQSLHPAQFKVLVLGQARPLHPVTSSELQRVGKEALYNSFRHADAENIEAELQFDADVLKLRIRDDGKGIDEQTLREGQRVGHWGLPGMHERARRIGASLVLWSRHGSGTEIEITVPAAIAYRESRPSLLPQWFARWLRKHKPLTGESDA